MSPSSAHAAIIAFRVDIEVDSGSGFVFWGTATAGGAIVSVIATLGDTVRFTIGIASATSSNITSYVTTVNADDPGEIDYIVGSGVNLLGINFAALVDPDTQLNDGTPGFGNINSAFGSAPGSNIDFYRVDYIVTTDKGDDLPVDFTVSGDFSTEGSGDLSAAGDRPDPVVDGSGHT